MAKGRVITVVWEGKVMDDVLVWVENVYEVESENALTHSLPTLKIQACFDQLHTTLIKVW